MVGDDVGVFDLLIEFDNIYVLVGCWWYWNFGKFIGDGVGVDNVKLISVFFGVF